MKSMLSALLFALSAQIAAACPQCLPENVNAVSVEVVIFERPLDEAAGTNWINRLGQPNHANAYGAFFDPLAKQTILDAIEADSKATLLASATARFAPPWDQRAAITPTDLIYTKTGIKTTPPEESQKEKVVFTITPGLYSSNILNNFRAQLSVSFHQKDPSAEGESSIGFGSQLCDISFGFWPQKTEVSRFILKNRMIEKPGGGYEPSPTELFLITTLHASFPSHENEFSLDPTTGAQP